MPIRLHNYEEVKEYINEGDVLLFRGKGWISRIISGFGGTDYSHVGMASWINGDANTLEGVLELLEFREFAGGRAINLQIAIEQNPEMIDVYRPIPIFGEFKFNDDTKEVKYTRRKFNGKAVTKTMRRLSGLPYSYKRIWWIFKHKLWIWKLFADKNKLTIDNVEDLVYPVCSTSLAYAFNKNGFDLIKNRSDQWSEPSDIAKSARLTYLFTLK